MLYISLNVFNIFGVIVKKNIVVGEIIGLYGGWIMLGEDYMELKFSVDIVVELCEVKDLYLVGNLLLIFVIINCRKGIFICKYNCEFVKKKGLWKLLLKGKI